MSIGRKISVSYSKKFLKSLSRLPDSVVNLAEEKEKIFKDNPFDSRLETHKLHGKDRDIWSFSITRSYRIKFVFLDSNSVLFLEIGTHDIYK